MLPNLSALLRCDLAVDLGTAMTRIALPDEGVVLEEPSVVAVARTSNRVLSSGCAVGHLAKQMSGRTPDSVQVVRPLSAGVITDSQLCEAMLRYFLRKARPSRLRLRPRLLIAAPACLTQVERRAIFMSAHRAGAGQVMLLRVAQAAALGAKLPVAEPLASMVIDLGAGRTDVAVLSMGDVVAEQSVRVGGDALDAAIVDWLRRAHGLRVGLATAEQLRIHVGSASVEHASSDEEVTGLDISSGLPRSLKVSAADLCAALQPPLETLLQAICDTLDRCGPDLVADLVERGVTLCGGAANLRGLTAWMKQRTGLSAVVTPTPATTVIEGTLTCLEHLDAWRCLVETSEHAA
jgi:rod shape-determining protein MreB and related proteins